MSLPKHLTGWLNVTDKLPALNFSHLRQRLIIAYLLVMGAVLGLSGTALYIFFARSLNQQLDHRLQTLVQAAAPSLNTVKYKGRENLARDLPWREMFFQRKQSLEWFNVDGKLISKEGEFFPQAPLIRKTLSTLGSSSPVFQQEDNIRSVTIAVYADGGQKDIIQLKGYIRASESTESIEVALKQLHLGLWLGGGTAVFFIGLSSVYLTHQALEPTLKSFRQLKQFAADASHELGGPLTKISFASEILLSNPEQLSKPSATKKIEIIKSGAEQMKHLLEDLLFLARTDSAAPMVRPENTCVFLDELLQQLAEHYTIVARNKEIDFQTNFYPDLAIQGDVSQLNRLFSNLLSNACKYTRSGGRILMTSGISNKNAVISVEDTGIGIDSRYLPHVFQRFWRAERVSKQEGLGLGLAIAKTIVQQHKGKITVTSEVNVGTCFKVYLPLYQR
ncbi:MAG: HAMP domain-containing sensor histidine kinase [Pleurocapsa sp. MO_226.B13]|nr:HAMP domain-containing sensor histidine kinase [Pleurocapsa sp. MO_226.B13]